MTLKAARTLGFEVVTLGDHIKRKRFELGLYQRELAARLGVCHKTIINWETGDTNVPMRAYPAVLAFLGYDPFPEPQTLAERLQAIRRGRGWKVRTAAKSIGVDEDTWRLWEAGRTPSRKHGAVISRVLDSRSFRAKT